MIKVMIERHIADDLTEHYHKAASKTMQQAMQSRGFISGESLKNADDSNHRFVFATYRTEADWSIWYHSPERKAMMEILRPMLLDEEKITILEHL